MGYKLTWVYIRPNGTEQKIRPTSRLPLEYQEVEYIENTWQSYINTWVTYDTNGRVFQIKYWLPVWWAYTLFGNFPSWSESAWHTRYSKLSDWTLEWDCFAWGGYWRIYASWATTGIDELELWNNYIKDIPTDTVLVSWNTWSYTNSSATMKIFYRDWWANNWFATFKLYYFKIIDSWTPTRDFVPCYRIADDVIWLYDLANDVFYTNDWTWTFTKWPDV